MKSLSSIIKELKNLLAKGIDLTLAELRKTLNSGAKIYEEFLLLEGRYKETNKQLILGTLDQTNATIEFNRIRQGLLLLINSIKKADLQEFSEDAEQLIPDVHNGEVFYRIPKTMQVNVETECLVRLDFDRERILKDIQLVPGDVLKDLRISDVMGVELLDPNGQANFKITTLHDTVQFIDPQTTTEWRFFVTPLNLGKNPLVLKISIVEIKDGVERRRNEVLRENIEIITEAVKVQHEEFKASALAWEMITADTVRVVHHDGSESAARGTGQNKRFKKIGVLIPVALLVFFGLAAGYYFLKQEPRTLDTIADEPHLQPILSRRIPRELRDYIKAYPDTKEAKLAALVLDTLDEQQWLKANQSKSVEGYEDYLVDFSGGKYAELAMLKVDALKYVITLDTIAADTKVKIIETPKPSKPADRPTRTNPSSRPEGSKPANSSTDIQATPASPRAASRDEDYEKVARQPAFKECNQKNPDKQYHCTEARIEQFLKRNLNYPQEAKNAKLEGTVVITFVVEKDGSVSTVEARNDIGGGCAAEAIRLIRSFPKFTPGQNEAGEAIRVKFKQPITFKIRSS